MIELVLGVDTMEIKTEYLYHIKDDFLTLSMMKILWLIMKEVEKDQHILL